ncbi:Protein of unknown function [Pyronema omphalodes CBS 100304]|uniref:Uncharacterized protein n=1 Tax=Pyronema omphalodes (strain CBS 100304) TaxID=1076935 RepID=U4LF78_PYROM|nr:Protein of unknown function [Pyronema omphalodes CBS 100304]
MTPYNHRDMPNHSRWSHGQRCYAVDRTQTRIHAPLMRRGREDISMHKYPRYRRIGEACGAANAPPPTGDVFGYVCGVFCDG